MLNDQYVEMLKDDYKVSYSLFKKGKKMVAFSSHQPVLIHTLNTIKTGKVLEFGMGYNSTPIMNLICGMQDRPLLSLETNQEWYDKFVKYAGIQHQVIKMDARELVHWKHYMFRQKYSVAFVDGAPAEIRQPFLEKIKDIADYIIVHDTECVVQGVKNCYAFDFSMFKHVYHLTSSLPMTSLLSNLEEIDQELLTIF